MKRLVAVAAGLLVAAVAVIAQDRAPERGHVLLPASELVWTGPPPGLPAGARMAVLSGDPTGPGLFTIELWCPPGYRILPHTHPMDEHVTVISGAFNMSPVEGGGHELRQGGFAMMPAGFPHFGFASEASLLEVHAQGPWAIDYLDPKDDPRNK